MAKGVKTGGRRKGVRNKRTTALVNKVEAEGITPLEYMLAVMREPEPTQRDDEEGALFVARYFGWRDRAFEAAKAAAPYVHPKLANIEHSGKGGQPLQVTFTHVDSHVL